jgi:hypothetical protein
MSADNTLNNMMAIDGGSNIAHGFTDFAATRTILTALQVSTTTGGASFRGFGETNIGLFLACFGKTPDTTTGTGGIGLLTTSGYDDSGTGVTDCAAGANIVVFRNNVTAAQIFKADGDIHTNTDQTAGLAGTFDEEQDALACRDLGYGITGAWDKVLTYNREKLENLGVMTNGFLSDRKFKGLVLGAIGEMMQVIDYGLRELVGVGYEEVRQLIRAS